MSRSELNALGQPVGRPLPGWTARPRPPHTPLEGRWCVVEPLDAARHGEDLHRANSADREDRMWTYLPYGPFGDLAAYLGWLETAAASEDPLFFAVVDRRDGRAKGVLSLLRIDAGNGSAEVGHIAFSPALQRTRAATEALALLATRVFDELGYRRYEWKCDALNAPSRRAAERLGFAYEGTFRQAVVVKGRNRDTAWYAMTDEDWPRIRDAYRRWLAPESFDGDGRQLVALSALTAAREAGA
jgi:RimJ/RimL family protein N-acetyltransferase